MKVSIGPSSILGWISSAALSIYAIANALSENQSLLTGQNKPAAIGSLILLVATSAGRQLQAAAAAHKAPPAQALLPSDAEELASPPPPQ